MHRPPAKVGGYTIIELILVIVIIGIIGVVAGPRFFDSTSFGNRAFYDELASALRYGQKVAVASGCPVRVAISASSYSLTQQSAAAGHCNLSDTSFSTAVLLPSGEPLAGNAPDGVTASPPLTFVYNAEGQTSLSADQVLSIGGRALTVVSTSGLVVTP